MPEPATSDSPLRIPKRIIQMRFSQNGKKTRLPLRLRAMASNLRLINPDYDYMFFDDDSLDAFFENEFPEYRAVFDAFSFPIQRYDFFRYLAIYRYGGFYFDLDVLLATDLSSLLDYSCVFPYEGLTFSEHLRSHLGMDWQIGNYAFGAAPGHPFLKAVIDNCVRSQKDPNWAKPMLKGFTPFFRNECSVLITTGPTQISRTLAENPDLAKTVIVLFPDDLDSWNQFGEIGVHMMDGGWRSKSGFLRRRLSLYWEVWQLNKVKKRLSPEKTRARVFSPRDAM
jgi:inositol phosphorylceramide mannosyltransferase catalytic subunit